MLGAAGDGLRNQWVILKIAHVDGARLKQKMAQEGRSSMIAPAAMLAVDALPKAIVDIALPIVSKQLLEYGVTAELTAADTPPAQGGRARSEFFPGAIIGAGATAVIFGIGWGTWRLLLSRLF
jgi:hypothetical protein